MLLRLIELVAFDAHSIQDGRELAVVEVIQWREVSVQVVEKCGFVPPDKVHQRRIAAHVGDFPMFVQQGDGHLRARAVHLAFDGGFIFLVNVSTFNQLLDRLDRAAHCRTTLWGLHDNAVEQPSRQHQS